MLPAAGASVARVPTIRGAEARPTAAYRPDRVLVKYREAAAKSALERDAVRASVGGTLSRSYTTLPTIEAIALGPGTTVEAAVAALSADPSVEYAEPDFLWTVDALPNDPKFVEQWGLNNTGQPIGEYPGEQPGVDVDAPEAWEHGTGSADVVVADIDEGCDYRHPDLAANIWTNPGELRRRRARVGFPARRRVDVRRRGRLVEHDGPARHAHDGDDRSGRQQRRGRDGRLLDRPCDVAQVPRGLGRHRGRRRVP
jgi:subtilisin family serine protease